MKHHIIILVAATIPVLATCDTAPQNIATEPITVVAPETAPLAAPPRQVHFQIKGREINLEAFPNEHLQRVTWGGILYSKAGWSIELDANWTVYLKLEGYTHMPSTIGTDHPRFVHRAEKIPLATLGSYKAQGYQRIQLEGRRFNAAGKAEGTADQRSDKVDLKEINGDPARTLVTSIRGTFGSANGHGARFILQLRDFDIMISK